eukprot:scaffold29234_cov36-Phaeocystis_antarctica.AAC.1
MWATGPCRRPPTRHSHTNHKVPLVVCAACTSGRYHSPLRCGVAGDSWKLTVPSRGDPKGRSKLDKDMGVKSLPTFHSCASGGNV